MIKSEIVPYLQLVKLTRVSKIYYNQLVVLMMMKKVKR